MTVHVDEIHTQISASTPGPGSGPQAQAEQGSGGAKPPGSREDLWRAAEARVHRLRCRVTAEGFDD